MLLVAWALCWRAAMSGAKARVILDSPRAAVFSALQIHNRSFKAKLALLKCLVVLLSITKKHVC